MKPQRFISLLLVFWTGCLFMQAQKIVKDSIKIQGHQRHFFMYLPDELPENAPLVFALHGYGNRGNQKSWMNEAANRHKFAVCIPVGLKDPKGKNSWNVGYPFQEGWRLTT